MTKFNLSKNEVNILTQIMRMPLHYDVNIEELTIKEINIPNKEMKFIKGFTKEGEPIKISVPPTLLISSIGVMDDVKKAVTMDPKTTGDLVYIIGETADELGGSEYYDYRKKGTVGSNIPQVDAKKALELYRTYHKAVEKELLASSISLVFGGIAVGLAKKAISAQLGLEIDISKNPNRRRTPN